MRKVLGSFLAASLLTLTGCPNLASVKVHAPPQYEDGKPTDLYYEKLAMRTQEMSSPGEIPSDPKEAYQLALQEIEDNGITIVPKAEGLEVWGKFTTTFPTTIYVSTSWDEKSIESKAATMWHELVHVREYDHHGELLMGLMYFTPTGRWALEVQAYREGFRVWRAFGRSEEWIQSQMRPRAEAVYESYELGGMPKEYAVEKAIEIWMLDSK